MVNQGKTTLQFPQKATIYDANDALVFVYAADTANTSNTIAQTAIITVGNFVNSAGIGSFPAPMQFVSFSLTPSQILNCNTSPITLVAAPGANNVIVPLSLYGWSSDGTIYGNITNFGLFYANTTLKVDSSVFYTLSNIPLRIYTQQLYVSTSLANTVNLPLVIQSSTGNLTGGNTTISGFFQYIVLENLP